MIKLVSRAGYDTTAYMSWAFRLLLRSLDIREVVRVIEEEHGMIIFCLVVFDICDLSSQEPNFCAS